MTNLGYARVSTDAQDTALQHDALHQAGVERVWEDSMTGARLDRPGLRGLLEYARPGDIIVVYSISRLSRSVRDLLNLVDDLDAAGVGLRSITEPVDTSAASPYGRFTVQLLGALAELERGMLRERTLAGVTAARQRGRVGGRPPADPERVEAARALIQSGTSPTQAASITGLGRSTVYRVLADEIAAR